MSANISAWFMVGLDVLMIVYTLWILSLGNKRKLHIGIAGTLLVWLVLLHLGLSTQSIFAADISGTTFLLSIFMAVGMVGILLMGIPAVRQALLNLDQKHLMLLQGIRVFFGAGFLMQASLGVLPKEFGIIDGFSHIGAGFFGLIAAFSLATNENGNRRAWFANIFGLADILIVVTTLALILLPEIGPHHSIMYAVFLPAPLLFWFHLISIWKLLRCKQQSTLQEARI